MFTIAEILKDYGENNLPIEKVYKKYGGFNVYIPKVDPEFKAKVVREFNGKNEASLATKYNIALNTVKEVIRESRKME